MSGIRTLIKKKELRYSLKTGSLRCAKARASDMIAFIRSLVNDISSCQPDSFTATQVSSLIKNKLQEVTSKTHRIVPMAVSPAITPSRLSGAGPKLSDVLGRYVADAKKAKQWSPKTEQEVISCIELFIQAIGDRQVHTIEKASVRGYKETLLRLPSNLRKLPEYRDKTNPRDPDWITTSNCL